jgi:hypothetical protein
LSDLNSKLGQLASTVSDEMSGLEFASYALIVCGILGLITSVLILMRKFNRWANAGILILCGVLPLFFYTDALFGVPMTLAGLFALAVKYDTISTPASPSKTTVTA